MDFLEELNETLTKVYREKVAEGKYTVTTSELFIGAKKYMELGEYFERFCNDHNTGWQFKRVNEDLLDFKGISDINIIDWKGGENSGDRTQDCTV